MEIKRDALRGILKALARAVKLSYADECALRDWVHTADEFKIGTFNGCPLAQAFGCRATEIAFQTGLDEHFDTIMVGLGGVAAEPIKVVD